MTAKYEVQTKLKTQILLIWQHNKIAVIHIHIGIFCRQIVGYKEKL